MTDAEGKFAFEGLDPELYFQLLVYERGYVPTYTEGYYDPRAGEMEIGVERHDLAERDPEFVLRGIVVDAQGTPVPRAALTPIGAKLARGALFGELEGVDELALTDEKGEFELGVAEPGQTLLLQVRARGFATRMSPWVAAGTDIEPLLMGRGVTVTGLVMKGTEPLSGVELGLAQVDRNADRFLGERTIGTGPDGRFTFVNVAPDDAWTLYGLMASLKTHGALAVRTVATGANETTVDAGTLVLEPGSRLRGRVTLSDGSPLPDDFRLLLSREAAWDTQVALVDPSGDFEFTGLPRELFTLSTRLKGYVISPRNESHDFLNHQGLLGRIDEDTHLVLLLEPGIEDYRSPKLDKDLWERYQALEKTPLRGAPLEATGTR